VFDHALGFPVRDYTTQSRFVLYDSGAVALQYVSLGNAYHGGYMASNGTLTFEWAGNGWSATGTVSGRVLMVHYSAWMQLSDFEDAVYQETSSTLAMRASVDPAAR